MIIYTMGFTQKSAEEFFGKILQNHIDIVVDVRLNNRSQLAGFTKGKDLEYFLKELADCRYDHKDYFAPTKELLQDYKKGITSWDDYTVIYNDLIQKRRMTDFFMKTYKDYQHPLLLCSEPTPEQCHRRLLAEAIHHDYHVDMIHI